MDAIPMLRTAVVIFAVAAAGGMLMAGIRFMGKRNPPAWVAMVHGLLAAAGLTLVIYAGYTTDMPVLGRAAGAMLLLAAIGGAFLNLRYQWKHTLLPATIIVVHALLAVAGFACLVVAAFMS
jgi:hypothetical protein